MATLAPRGYFRVANLHNIRRQDPVYHGGIPLALCIGASEMGCAYGDSEWFQRRQEVRVVAASVMKLDARVAREERTRIVRRGGRCMHADNGYTWSEHQGSCSVPGSLRVALVGGCSDSLVSAAGGLAASVSGCASVAGSALGRAGAMKGPCLTPLAISSSHACILCWGVRPQEKRHFGVRFMGRHFPHRPARRQASSGGLGAVGYLWELLRTVYMCGGRQRVLVKRWPSETVVKMCLSA